MFGKVTFLPASKFNMYKNESRPVIFLIHGSGADDRQFILAKKILQKTAYPIESINLSNENLTIEEYSQSVAGYIRALGIKSIILIGVSMGGLIAAYYAASQDHDQVEIKGIVTIGSPFGGAPALNYYPQFMLNKNKRYAQMRPGSEFLKNLSYKMDQNIIQLNNGCKYLSFGSVADLHVPDEFSRPFLPVFSYYVHHTHVSLKMPGHIALTIYPFIFHRINSFISSLD